MILAYIEGWTLKDISSSSYMNVDDIQIFIGSWVLTYDVKMP